VKVRVLSSAPKLGHNLVMSPQDLLSKKRNEILLLAQKHGASNVRIFGSVASGTANERSDFDILVSMEDGRGLLDFIGLWQDLEELLGRKVDLLSDRGLSPYLRDRILAEARPL
jgi:uncharacterized protein